MQIRLLLGLCYAAGLLNAQTNLTTAMTQRYFAGIRKNLESSADAMPADPAAIIDRVRGAGPNRFIL